jgi:hypothetical protein
MFNAESSHAILTLPEADLVGRKFEQLSHHLFQRFSVGLREDVINVKSLESKFALVHWSRLLALLFGKANFL